MSNRIPRTRMHAVAAMVAAPVLALLLSCAAGSASTGESLPHESRALSVVPLRCSGCTGDIARTSRARELFEDAESFRRAFLESVPEGTEVPEVDFSRFVVVAAWMGQQANCGSALAIPSARESGTRVEVEVRTSLPGNCAADDAISYPFCFARVEKVAKPYVFLEKTETRVCE
ncbi:hypothetical protein [Cystobacter ferrugineus]|nr:hypothetical protein [Cystobacter ferrugineus]